MEASELIPTIAQTLVHIWQWDIEVMSQPWMYYWLLMPATAFFAFMILQWTAITMPIWVPILIVANAMKQKADTSFGDSIHADWEYMQQQHIQIREQLAAQQILIVDHRTTIAAHEAELSAQRDHIVQLLREQNRLSGIFTKP